MIAVKVKTKSATWNTDINGTIESARAYFMQSPINVGEYPVEKMERVVSVEEVIEYTVFNVMNCEEQQKVHATSEEIRHWIINHLDMSKEWRYIKTPLSEELVSC